MDRIDWVKKLTSRKFWLAVVEFVSMLLITIGMPENKVGQIASLIMAGAGVIAYILAEGLADKASIESNSTVTHLFEEDSEE